MNYRIAPEARQDLADIWWFIAQESPSAADRVLDTIRDHFRLIAQNQELGRERSELAPGLRSLVVRKYRRYLVFYRPRSDEIDIVRVLDGSRDLNRMFKQ